MEEKGLENISAVIPAGDGKVLIAFYENDYADLCLIPYDIKENRLGEKTLPPKAVQQGDLYNAASDSAGNLIYTTSAGVFRYRMGEKEPEQVMSFVNSDLNITGFMAMTPVDEEHFAAFYFDDDQDSFQSTVTGGLFTRVAPEDVPDKKVIVLAGNYIDWQLRGRIVKYNRDNKKYRIVLWEYEDGVSDGQLQTQMDRDILSGNTPDILVWDNPSKLPGYVRKGLFADIGELIKQDSELPKLSYLQNVFDACKLDGKLYEVVPSFYINTYAGKKSPCRLLFPHQGF